jgi:hypothetical protein
MLGGAYLLQRVVDEPIFDFRLRVAYEDIGDAEGVVFAAFFEHLGEGIVWRQDLDSHHGNAGYEFALR